MHYPESTLYNSTYFFLVIYAFMHIYFVSYSSKKKKPHLFHSLPDFLLIPDFEDKQYLEQIHSLQMGGVQA